MEHQEKADKIEEVLTRSISAIYPSKEKVSEALMSGKQLRMYVGIDPTATYVHLGHSTNYIILKRFHELGHKIIVLIGDFTAMIGDPSDKTSARRKLTKEDILKNLKTFKKQIGKILDFKDKQNPIEFQFNTKWLNKLRFEEVVNLASNFTVQQMIERDTFQKRLKEQKPLYVHEFFYPLMQGYDSVALDADMEIGGTDQTFNMLAGRTLVKNYQQREKFVITTTLLENPITGEKLMSKSLGTGIGLDEDAFSMYEKVMRLPDETIIQCFIDCTYVSLSDIETIKNSLANNANPRDIKMKLADEVVTMYHGKAKAKKARNGFIQLFQKKEISDVVPEVSGNGRTFEMICLDEKVVASKSELRRLFTDGAVMNFETKEKMVDVKSREIPPPGTYKIGKNRFIKII